MSKLAKSSYFKAGFLAQLSSIAICGTAIITSQLSDEFNINIPTAQTLFNYVLLTILYTPAWFYVTNDHKSILDSLRQNWWRYLVISLADVEANYFMVKAYSYTVITTIQVIDASILPIALFLSYFLLKLSYKINNYIGVALCLVGCGLIVLADSLVKNLEGQHRLIGDLFCLLSSFLYAVSNVSSEIFVKNNSKLEYLSLIGLFSTIISLIQMMIFERSELSHLFSFNQTKIWILFAAESVCMFFIYTIMPVVLEMSSAAFLNVNLLTADFYAVLVGVFMKQYQLHYLYFVGLALIVIGTILYSLRKPSKRNDVNGINNETYF